MTLELIDTEALLRLSPPGDAGRTKYSLRKMVRLALNSITSFTHVPLQFATYLGVLASGFSFLYILYLIAKKIILNTAVEGWTSTMVAIFFFAGVQLLCLGIIGEYLGRVYSETQARPLYVVESEIAARDEPLDGLPSAAASESSDGVGAQPMVSAQPPRSDGAEHPRDDGGERE